MAWKPISARISNLPLVLAGPILRRVEKDNVSVWLALKEPCLAKDGKQLTLEVYNNGRGTAKGTRIMQGGRDTVSLGEHLHIVVLTAKTSGTLLQSGITYSYNVLGNGLDFTSDDDVCYPGFTLPTFSLPPANLNTLRILHASCRKFHAQGTDAMADVDAIIDEASKTPATMPDKRPHQLFLTGDQIYADDVDGLLLFLIRDLCEGADAALDIDAPAPLRAASSRLGLLNWEEELRGGTLGPTIGYKLSIMDSFKGQLEVGRRSELLKEESGLHFPGEWDVAENHLIKLGEYYAMYLLMWSPVLWPKDHEYPAYRNVFSKKYFPQEPNPLYAPVGTDEVVAEHSAESGGDTINYTTFCRSVTRAKYYQDELSAIRRGLANVPTYMICDDHEVTDDWFLDQHWCDTVLNRALGSRIVQNGLTAYTLFQGWGNAPAQFEQPMGRRLLETMTLWEMPDNYDNSDGRLPYLLPSGPVQSFWRTIGVSIGMPSVYLSLNQRQLLPQHPDRLLHHYYIAWDNHEVLVLDTRTARAYPGSDGDYAALISRESLRAQLGEFSRQNNTVEVTFLVIATPISGIPNVEDALLSTTTRTLARTEVGPFASASDINYRLDTEGYGYQQKGLQDLYAGICRGVAARQNYSPTAAPGRVVVLSGDVHYGFTNRVEFWADRFADMAETDGSNLGPTHFVMAQLCASALKNERDHFINIPFLGRGTGTYGHKSVGETGYTADEVKHPAIWLGWIPPAQGSKQVGTLDYPFTPPSESARPLRVSWHTPVLNTRVNYGLTEFVPNISVQPDWMYRISYLKALPPPGGPPAVATVSSPSTGTATAPTAQQRADSLLNYLAASKNTQNYLLDDSVGLEVVGKNNLGEVTFNWGTTEADKFVCHYLWWSKANSDGTDAQRKPHSKFRVLLGEDDTNYPRPTSPFTR